MKVNLNLEGAYSLEVEYVVIPRQGSSMALTLNDIVNGLKSFGDVSAMINLIDGKARVLVIPNRHVITGEDAMLTLEESGKTLE